MAPAMAGMFKSTGVIPVYRDVRIKTTFSKSFETLGDGMDVVIFPESIVPNPENPYLDTMQRGAFKFIGLCKKYTGSVPKIYPTYCCKSLKTVLIGAPLTFDETIPTADAEEKLKSELNEAVKALAETLPKHKPTHYSYLPKNIDVLKKYMGIHEEEVYEMLRTYYATQTQLKVES
jgi:1-acyl-sn-glycerol-3-phosphate acyltransferase